MYVNVLFTCHRSRDIPPQHMMAGNQSRTFLNMPFQNKDYSELIILRSHNVKLCCEQGESCLLVRGVCICEGSRSSSGYLLLCDAASLETVTTREGTDFSAAKHACLYPSTFCYTRSSEETDFMKRTGVSHTQFRRSKSKARPLARTADDICKAPPGSRERLGDTQRDIRSSHRPNQYHPLVSLGLTKPCSTHSTLVHLLSSAALHNVPPSHPFLH